MPLNQGHSSSNEVDIKLKKVHYIAIAISTIALAGVSYTVALNMNKPKITEEKLPTIIVSEEEKPLDSELETRLNEDFGSIMADIGRDTRTEMVAPIISDAVTQTETIAMEASQTIEPEFQNAQEITSEANQPRYVLNAEMFTAKEGYSQIALIIDDLGVKPMNSKRTIEKLPAEITLAFLPYGKATAELAMIAREKRHEVMIHLPMEPMSASISPGEDALYVSDTTADIERKTQINLDKLKNISVGVNNHMGSRFTGFEAGMKAVLPLVAKEQLMFLDSLTTSKTATTVAAQGLDMPILKRDSFIDHVIEEEAILKALEKLEAKALKKGAAIGIGHPHTATLNVLEKWVSTLDEKKIQLVPITALIAK